MKRWLRRFYKKGTGRAVQPQDESLADPRSSAVLHTEEEQLIKDDGVFDPTYYLERNPDVAEAQVDPLKHFCEFGWRERRDPSPFFSVTRYLDANLDVLNAEVNPLLHYILHGEKEGRSPSDCVSLPHIRLHLDDDPTVSTLGNFQKQRRSLALTPHPQIDLEWLMKTVPRALDEEDPLKWFLTQGWKLGLGSNGFSDRHDQERISSAALRSPDVNAFFRRSLEIMGVPAIPQRPGQRIIPKMHSVIVEDFPLPRFTTLDSLAVFVFLDDAPVSRTELFEALADLKIDLDLTIATNLDHKALPDWINRSKIIPLDSEQLYVALQASRNHDVWLFLDNRFDQASPASYWKWRSRLHNLIGSPRHLYEAVSNFARCSKKARLIPFDCSPIPESWVITPELWRELTGYVRVVPELLARIDSALRDPCPSGNEPALNNSLRGATEDLDAFKALIVRDLSISTHEVRFFQSQMPFSLRSVFHHHRPYLSKKSRSSYQDYKNRQGNARACVYTAIIGNYDNLKAPEFVEPDVDYICFSDGPIRAHPIWTVVRIRYFHIDPTRTARFVKLNPHKLLPQYEICIWADANILLRKPLRPLIEELGPDAPLLFLKHPRRECVYEEAEACKVLGNEADDALDRQCLRYRTLGIPENCGLYETNFFIVDTSNHETRLFFETWWSELQKESRRDQLALAFVKFTTGIEPNYLFDGVFCTRDNSTFALFSHGCRRNGYFEDPEFLNQIQSFQLQPTAQTWKQRNEPYIKPPLPGRPPAAVVICIHNSYEAVRECIESVIATFLPEDKLVIVDDASNDEQILAYLSDLQTNRGTRVSLLRNEENLGYTKSANLGMRAATTEFLVLLNSDAVVPMRWLDKIFNALYSHPDVGVVGPMSNAASYQSLPDIAGTKDQTAVNDFPCGQDLDSINQLCVDLSNEIVQYPLVPLVHGFCLAIKNEVFERIGYFDEELFPFGYGEENDFCLRAGEAGFDLMLANDLFVFHHKSQSFSDPLRRMELMRDGSIALETKHGRDQVRDSVRIMKHHPCLQQIRRRFTEECDSRASPLNP
jgi:O-antigen biosynthesis protein